MHVNNEIGVIQDIERIGEIIKDKSSRAKFHVDAVQSFCKAEIDVNKYQIDLLSVSGHKIHGPRGVGAAYVRKGLVPKPLIIGGGQEKNIRSGTENLPAIWGMARACEIMNGKLEENYIKVNSIKEYFINKIKSFENIIINSPMDDDFLPYILSVTFKGIKGEVLLHLLEDAGIYVSTGSACSARKNSESYVLSSINLCKNDITGTIRFSFNETNTKDEADYVCEQLDKSLKFLTTFQKGSLPSASGGGRYSAKK
jgi:cysteine desulfurase